MTCLRSDSYQGFGQASKKAIDNRCLYISGLRLPIPLREKVKAEAKTSFLSIAVAYCQLIPAVFKSKRISFTLEKSLFNDIDLCNVKNRKENSTRILYIFSIMGSIDREGEDDEIEVNVSL